MDEKEQLIQEINSLRKRIVELENSENVCREIVQESNSIILRLDTSGNVTFFNQYAQRFFGYYENEIIGKNIVGTIVPETSETGVNLRTIINNIVADPQRYSTNVNENMRSNGERVWVAWTNKAIIDDQGKIKEVLCIGNDISKIKQHIEALKQARGLPT